jgi:hypothetical protein
VRSLFRHRESLVQMATTHVNQMQKAQLQHVISDIVRQTGLAIVRCMRAKLGAPKAITAAAHKLAASSLT